MKEEEKTKKARWIVHTKGFYGDRPSFEIVVIREDYELGFKSFGWMNEDKICIADSGPARWPLTKMVWDKLLRIADEVCYELNLKDQV